LDRRNSKRICVFWVAGLLLISGAIALWLAVVPTWQTCEAVKRCRLDAPKYRGNYHPGPDGKAPPSASSEPVDTVLSFPPEVLDREIANLGGPNRASSRLLVYLGLPRRVAPYPAAAIRMIERCGVASADVMDTLEMEANSSDARIRYYARRALRKLRGRGRTDNDDGEAADYIDELHLSPTAPSAPSAPSATGH
jgi:hypothetical protein